jgi:hypothetical protein
MVKRNLRMCVDRILPAKDQVKAAERAKEELAANAPIFLVGSMGMGPFEMALVTNKKWAPGRKLGIAFLAGTVKQQNYVRSKAEIWLPLINLGFDWSVPANKADIRIAFKAEGAWSYIGTDALSVPKTQPTMNFGFLEPGTVEHEFGHMLGCLHEHQQPAAEIPWNKAAVYAYYGGPPNNWDKPTIDANIFERYARELTQFTAWDKGSIMEYPIERALVTDPAFAVGWNQTLSTMDKTFIAQAYPKAAPPPATGPIVITIPAGTPIKIEGWTP